MNYVFFEHSHVLMCSIGLEGFLNSKKYFKEKKEKKTIKIASKNNKNEFFCFSSCKRLSLKNCVFI